MQSFDTARSILAADCCDYGVANMTAVSTGSSHENEQSVLPTFKKTVKDMGGQETVSTSQQNMHTASARASLQILMK
jgi:hypothetical protein